MFSISFGIGTESSFAQPAVDEKTVLQICQALSTKAPGLMPAIVPPEAARRLMTNYERFTDILSGCLSAAETEHTARRAGFLVQNTRYETRWYFVLDESSIGDIVVEAFRPITLADDGEWQTFPNTRVVTAAPTASESTAPSSETADSRPITKGHRRTAYHHMAKKSRASANADRESAPPPAAEARTTSSARDPYIVEFHYATNRKVSDVQIPAPEVSGPESSPPPDESPAVTSGLNLWTPVSDYTGERSADLSFGAVSVRVPEGHLVGQVELPWRVTILGHVFTRNDQTRYFTLRDIERTTEDEWITSLSHAKGKVREKKALVFVHGFNTKFQDAAFRMAQIIWDLQFQGTAVLFSWPSRGEIADYGYDKDSALGSRAALLRVITDLQKAGFDEIDIIAHSMGNLVAVDALSNSAATQSPVAIAQLIMAAPDVDRDMFIQEVPNLAKVAKGLTLYASANDKALMLSKRVAGDIPRAGDVPASGPIVLAPLSTIDVSAVGNEMFGLNHNTFASTKNVLNDLKILLATGAPPPRLSEIHGYPEPPLVATYFRYLP
ncbi:MAG: alpha/beta fold hydrolase [Bradyrhizobium sp.]|uniref:alpha/beta hydrolase n=1 Tax=Bradyrhizobium sp. TaxID=376 RepID=UPI001DD8C08A|nr:alpha/beta fold hydrolase [Bradyrhizobium sp.]MBV9565569.1 alpha/beta fold hydrolase [Bradyrhizobium sp.]